MRRVPTPLPPPSGVKFKDGSVTASLFLYLTSPPLPQVESWCWESLPLELVADVGAMASTVTKVKKRHGQGGLRWSYYSTT